MGVFEKLLYGCSKAGKKEKKGTNKTACERNQFPKPTKFRELTFILKIVKTYRVQVKLQ